MIIQEEITIKVPSEVAQVYRNSTKEERQKLETKIAFFLKYTTTSRQEAIAKLRETMNKIGQKATERGLTQEILESILNEDE